MSRLSPFYISLFLIVSTVIFSLSLLLFIPQSGLPEHIVCWRSQPGVIYLHIIGDSLVWLAYTAIPVLILYIMRIGRVSSHTTFPVLGIFGALFVWLCGQTHLFDLFEIWYQVQWRRGILKVVAGVVSCVFVRLLYKYRLEIACVSRAINRVETEDEHTHSVGL